jgi:hypothetical protein
MKLMVQIEDDAHKIKVMQDPVFMKTFNRYLTTLQAVLPHLPLSELIWRFKFMIFSMHAIMVQHPFPANARIKNNQESIDGLLDYVITFVKAGFLAPSSSGKKME